MYAIRSYYEQGHDDTTVVSGIYEESVTETIEPSAPITTTAPIMTTATIVTTTTPTATTTVPITTTKPIVTTTKPTITTAAPATTTTTKKPATATTTTKVTVPKSSAMLTTQSGYGVLTLVGIDELKDDMKTFRFLANGEELYNCDDVYADGCIIANNTEYDINVYSMTIIIKDLPKIDGGTGRELCRKTFVFDEPVFVPRNYLNNIGVWAPGNSKDIAPFEIEGTGEDYSFLTEYWGDRSCYDGECFFNYKKA